MVDAVLAELPPLISESDMHVSQMALSFLSTLAVTHPSSLGQLSSGNILQQLIALVRSPLLQGGALAAMLDFYQVPLRLLSTLVPLSLFPSPLMSPGFLPFSFCGVETLRIKSLQ